MSAAVFLPSAAARKRAPARSRSPGAGASHGVQSRGLCTSQTHVDDAGWWPWPRACRAIALFADPCAHAHTPISSMVTSSRRSLSAIAAAPRQSADLVAAEAGQLPSEHRGAYLSRPRRLAPPILSSSMGASRRRRDRSRAPSFRARPLADAAVRAWDRRPARRPAVQTRPPAIPDGAGTLPSGRRRAVEGVAEAAATASSPPPSTLAAARVGSAAQPRCMPSMPPPVEDIGVAAASDPSGPPRPSRRDLGRRRSSRRQERRPRRGLVRRAGQRWRPHASARRARARPFTLEAAGLSVLRHVDARVRRNPRGAPPALVDRAHRPSDAATSGAPGGAGLTRCSRRHGAVVRRRRPADAASLRRSRRRCVGRWRRRRRARAQRARVPRFSAELRALSLSLNAARAPARAARGSGMASECGRARARARRPWCSPALKMMT